jgi:hypothetical protein
MSEPVECTFPAPKSKKTKKKSNVKVDVDAEDDEDASDGESKPKKAKAKPRKNARKNLDEEKDLASGSEMEDVGDEVSGDDFDGIESSSDAEGVWEVTAPKVSQRKR